MLYVKLFSNTKSNMKHNFKNIYDVVICQYVRLQTFEVIKLLFFVELLISEASK